MDRELMRFGLIGRGPFGQVYASTLRGMGIDFWQAGRDWTLQPLPDAAIIACKPEYHFKVAKYLIAKRVPILLEKPVCTNSKDSIQLLRQARHFGAIVFTGHTRLYSQAWRAFKANALGEGVRSVYAVAGSRDCKLPALWDWGGHLVAMCIDLGIDPLAAHIVTGGLEDWPLKVIVNGTMTYMDQPETPTPLEVLLDEFMAAIKKGEPDVRGLELGVKVVEAIETMQRRQERKYGT